MTPITTDRRLSLLWRTILLLTVFVMITQIFLYLWIQRSVKGHFEQMDAETLTHAAFNLRQRITDSDIAKQTAGLTTTNPTPQNLANQAVNSNAVNSDAINSDAINKQTLESAHLDYEVKTVIANKTGQIVSSSPVDFIDSIDNDVLAQLRQHQLDQAFILPLDNRHYRAVIIEHSKYLALIALPIDVHHQYLIEFKRQLLFILIAITLLLVSVAACSVHLGFAPLSTFSYKMQRINAEQLNDRIIVKDMPSELRPLADAYNAMMDELEHNFASLSRFSDDIAHELRTPLATLSTQTQVMLSKARDTQEYVEQLHHQHNTLEQLSGLINNMLLLAKTQKGLYNSQLNRVDIDSLLTKLINYYEFMAEDRGITFAMSGDFKSVLGDEGLLQRLFANLLSNAVYYAAADSVITIQTSTASKSSMTKIIISNQLAEALTQIEADKLSERFYRHDRDNLYHAGTGLGLSIVQAIAHAHNGEVSINVKDDYDFAVHIRLPTE